ncbi:MAG: cytochrome P450, partial [Myxococcota bacterium]
TSLGRPAPGPDGQRIRSVLALRKDRLGAFRRWIQQYGDIVRIPVGPELLYLVVHPDHVKSVLQDQARSFDKQTRGFAVIRRLLGQGLLTSEGKFWLRQRRIAQPVFGRRTVGAFAGQFGLAAQRLADRWAEAQNGQTIDVTEAMTRLTLSIVGETLLGRELTGEARAVGEALSISLHWASKNVTTPKFLLDLPTRSNRESQRAIQTLDRVVLETIDARRQASERPDDLLTRLMEATDPETGQGMSDQQLRDEVMTMFLAGHETTANALAFSLYLLGQHPEWAEKVAAEADAVLTDELPTADDLRRLDVTGRVVFEAMRLYPPAWIVPRRAATDTQLGEFHIEAGANLICFTMGTHRHPEFWPDPETFDPDRFLESAAPRHKFAYFPFGGGPRLCIGRDFALLEAVLVLATLMRRVRMVPAWDQVGLDPTITLRPTGLKMRVQAR